MGLSFSLSPSHRTVLISLERRHYLRKGTSFCFTSYALDSDIPLTILTATTFLSGVSGIIPSAYALNTLPKAPFPLCVIQSHYVCSSAYTCIFCIVLCMEQCALYGMSNANQCFAQGVYLVICCPKFEVFLWEIPMHPKEAFDHNRLSEVSFDVGKCPTLSHRSVYFLCVSFYVFFCFWVGALPRSDKSAEISNKAWK